MTYQIEKKDPLDGLLEQMMRGGTRESWAILILSSSCLPRRQSQEAPKSSKPQPQKKNKKGRDSLLKKGRDSLLY